MTSRELVGSRDPLPLSPPPLLPNFILPDRWKHSFRFVWSNRQSRTDKAEETVRFALAGPD